MRTWFATMFGWLSTPNSYDGPREAGIAKVSDYEQHLRQLDERGGRLFLP